MVMVQPTGWISGQSAGATRDDPLSLPMGKEKRCHELSVAVGRLIAGLLALANGRHA